jgi:uncharacterized protein (DUF2062 family)
MQRHIRLRIRIFNRHVRRFVTHKMLHADDPPHRLALGVAIGMFIAFTPTMGFQMLLVVFAAWLLRANKVVGLPIVWISNPATMVPLYYWCYLVGRVVLGHEGIGRHWWKELAHPPHGWWTGITFYWSRIMDIAAPLWLGSVMIGFIAAYVSYYAVYHGVCMYRMRRWGQLTPPLASRTPGRRGSKMADTVT